MCSARTVSADSCTPLPALLSVSPTATTPNVAAWRSPPSPAPSAPPTGSPCSASSARRDPRPRRGPAGAGRRPTAAWPDRRRSRSAHRDGEAQAGAAAVAVPRPDDRPRTCRRTSACRRSCAPSRRCPWPSASNDSPGGRPVAVVDSPAQRRPEPRTPRPRRRCGTSSRPPWTCRRRPAGRRTCTACVEAAELQHRMLPIRAEVPGVVGRFAGVAVAVHVHVVPTPSRASSFPYAVGVRSSTVLLPSGGSASLSSAMSLKFTSQ